MSTTRSTVANVQTGADSDTSSSGMGMVGAGLGGLLSRPRVASAKDESASHPTPGGTPAGATPGAGGVLSFEQRKAKAVKLRAAGLPVRKIAAVLGCRESTAYAYTCSSFCDCGRPLPHKGRCWHPAPRRMPRWW